MTIEAPRLLVVDDDEGFRDSLCEILVEHGYSVISAATRDEAIARFDAEAFDAVLLDQRLLGASGPPTGLDLLEDFRRRRPDAVVIVMTAFVERAAIERAFRSGAYDYLSKGPLFEVYLSAKLRNVTERWRERRAAVESTEGRETRIRELWRRAQTEPHKQKKGKLFEELLFALFESIDGFRPTIHASNDVEEIDVLVRNESPDPFWQKEGQYLLVECKNWQSNVGVNELRAFTQKLEHRYNRAKLGLFVSVGGFADTVERELLALRATSALVVLAGRERIEALVATSDRSTLLKAWHQQAVMARGE